MNGKILGLYPIICAYSLLDYVTLLLWIYSPILLLISLFYEVLHLLTRHSNRSNKRGDLPKPIKIILIIILVTLAAYPSIGNNFNYDFSLYLNIEPWQQKYSVVYSDSVFHESIVDPNYKDGLIIKCNSTGIFCKNIHEFEVYLDGLNHLSIKYDPDRGRLILFTNQEGMLYARTKEKELCNNYHSCKLIQENY